MVAEGSVIREAVQYLTKYQNITILFAPCGIGAIRPHDLEYLMADISLLAGVGITPILGEYAEEPLWTKVHGVPSDAIVVLKEDREVVDIARKKGVAKICFLCGTDFVHSSQGALNDISDEEAEKLLLAEGVKGDARRVVELAVMACRQGIPRVHLFNAHRRDALLCELFTRHGAGTMIYGHGSLYKEVRAAVEMDLLGISSMLRPIIRTKSVAAWITRLLPQFRVFAVDGEVEGCMHLTSRGKSIEVRHLAHSSRFNASEVLETLLKSAIEETKARALARIEVPTNDIPALMGIQPWFTRLGFSKERAGGGKTWIKKC